MSEEERSMFVSFRLRLLTAFLLFLCFFLIDQRHMEVDGIGSAQILEYIGNDMEMKQLLVWIGKKYEQ